MLEKDCINTALEATGVSQLHSQQWEVCCNVVATPKTNGHIVQGLSVLQSEARQRLGVSQYQQPHMLLQRGLQSLEQLLPGMQDAFLHAGATSVDCLADMTAVWYDSFTCTQACLLKLQ